MGKEKKKFVVSWDEQHVVVVEAENERKAWEKADEVNTDGDAHTKIYNEKIREIDKDEKD